MGDPGGRGIGLRAAAWVLRLWLYRAFWAAVSSAGLRAQEATIARPPPDEAAVRRDLLGRALADGSSGALILFLARYPDGPDAGTVRAALAARRQADPAPVGGPDGDIVAAFDRAPPRRARDARRLRRALPEPPAGRGGPALEPVAARREGCAAGDPGKPVTSRRWPRRSAS